MNEQIKIEQEADGRLLASIEELPGVMAYGATPEDATRAVVVLALRVLADRIERNEPVPAGVYGTLSLTWPRLTNGEQRKKRTSKRKSVSSATGTCGATSRARGLAHREPLKPRRVTEEDLARFERGNSLVRVRTLAAAV